MLVEPDVVLAQLYGDALRNAGYTVDIASTAQAAIRVADTQQPDLILLELQLVSHSGIEFLHEFRSYDEWQAIPVIIFSQVPSGEFGDWQLLRGELGVVEYLYKPRTSLQALLQAVRSVQAGLLPNAAGTLQ